jgi:hypothetical protein
MTSTVLNDTQRAFLEEIIVQFGAVVSYKPIAPYIPYKDDVAKRRFVSQLCSIPISRRSGYLVCSLTI